MLDESSLARESDVRNVRRQVSAISHLLNDMQRRLFSLEEAAANARADLAVARENDELLGAAIDQMLEDIAGGR